MTTTFRDLLESGKFIFFDGGMGTELVTRGVKPGAAASMNASESVLAVHRDYREAGADVLITNTFGANRQVLGRAGDADALPRYVSASCKLARKALGGGGFVAGDIGPTGEFLEPYGILTEVVVQVIFKETARLLAAEGVDLFLVETMTDAVEMTLAVQACREAAREAARDIPVAASMSFDPVKQGGFRTSTGLTAAEAVEAMVKAGADVIGANCGAITPQQMAALVREFRGFPPADVPPILAQPNAGLPELQKGQTVYRLAPEAFAAGMIEVTAAGAQLLGGCCGTTPAHIRAMRKAVEKK